MAKRGASIYGIAQLAGVCTATVSNALNQKGSYSAKTTEPPSIAVDLPVVHIDHRGTIGMRRETYVENDIHAMGYDMTQTLIDHGCTRVALASVSATVYHHGNQDQVAGYLRCLEDHGMPLDENLVLKGPHQQSSLVEAAQLVRDCLDAGHAFDGVVALGDRVALGVVNALKERGIAVGHDVRVIGMDDSIYSRVSTPAISTVRRNTAALAERGAQTMLAMLGDDKDVEAHVLVPHEVVERATTLG